MKKVIKIKPRQSGKTTELLNMFKNDDNSLFVIMGENLIHSIKELRTNKNVISFDNFKRLTLSEVNKYSAIFFDEFMFMNWDERSQGLVLLSNCECYLYSTSNDLYKRGTIDLIKKINTFEIKDKNSFKNKLLNDFNVVLLNNELDKYYKLLYNPILKLPFHNETITYFDKNLESDNKFLLNQMQYKTEILGHFFETYE